MRLSLDTGLAWSEKENINRDFKIININLVTIDESIMILYCVIKTLFIQAGDVPRRWWFVMFERWASVDVSWMNRSPVRPPTITQGSKFELLNSVQSQF